MHRRTGSKSEVGRENKAYQFPKTLSAFLWAIVEAPEGFKDPVIEV
jgi:hypothetical protein